MKIKVKETINSATKKYEDLIYQLDFYPDVVSQYIRGDIKVIDSTGFLREKISPRKVISEVNTKLNIYSKDESNKNFEILVHSVKSLVELNKNLSFFLREILYETNPNGNYEALIDEYE